MADNSIWARNEIESPCIQICVVHPVERICTGCYRSIDEISRWSRMTAAERKAVMDELSARASQLTKRRGGRAARLKRQG
ncbi:MAG: DUF1289 domain-containing protein [Rhodobacteraceae bacterium]|nr:DUF1289 domain-containing protein [Paracoccaceae bacterium]